MEALAAGAVREAWVSEGGDARLQRLVAALRSAGIPVHRVTKAELDTRVPPGAVHQGVVAAGDPAPRASLNECLEWAASRGQQPLLVYLDGVSDPHNLGAVARSAEVLGAHGLCLRRHRAAPVTSVAVKAAAGALAHLRVVEVASPRVLLEEAGSAGLLRVGLVAGERPLWELDLRAPLLLCLGEEGKGLGPLLRSRCDALAGLPSHGQVGSLNVSAAAAAALYEVARQRRPWGAA